MDMWPLSDAEWQAIALSLEVAGLALLVSLPLALAMGYLLARVRFPGHAIVNALVHLPLVMPPVVTGYVLLIAFGRNGPIGAFLFDTFGVVLAFRWTGAALAAGVMAFPLMVRPIRLALEGIDPLLEPAARTLGAGRLARLFTITLPLALPGILAAAILGFAKALGEFGATMTFVSNIPGETRTIALSIYTFIQSPDGDPAALRLTVAAIILSLGAILVSEWVARRVIKSGRS
jgi:molybdate transport system permease protein